MVMQRCWWEARQTTVSALALVAHRSYFFGEAEEDPRLPNALLTARAGASPAPLCDLVKLHLSPASSQSPRHTEGFEATRQEKGPNMIPVRPLMGLLRLSESGFWRGFLLRRASVRSRGRGGGQNK